MKPHWITATTLLCATVSAQISAETLEGIDTLIQPAIESGQYVGLAVGMYRKGDVVFRGYGQISADDPRVPDEHTLYEIGSISKTFNGLLMATTILEGKITLEDELQQHLPEGVTAPARDEAPILLVDLATHSSGLPRLPTTWNPADPDNPYADFDGEAIHEFFASDFVLPRDPGEIYAYSNLGAGVLNHVLELVHGRSFEALLQERICGPLGMTETMCQLTPELVGQFAPGHDADGRRVRSWDIALPGIGGIRSNTSDMMLYARAHIDPGDEFADVVDLATDRHFTNRARHIGVGLGWHIAADGMTFVHSGQTGGYTAFIAVNPRLDAASVVLANSASTQTPVIGERVLQRLLGIQVPALEIEMPIELSESTLQRYVGRYQLNSNTVVDVTLREQRLLAQLTDQQAIPIYPSGEKEFFYRSVDARITFVADGEGPATALVLHQHGIDSRAPRIG